ncbi:MAG: hypothetical protein U9R25_00225 [Chloroflexota bacterium]|nr:hypothetical protein [Chloroflexota bacterium]
MGDGINEITSWTFDFLQDPNIENFSKDVELTEARLTLLLEPGRSDVYSDTVKTGGLSAIRMPSSVPSSVGVPVAAVLDLLSALPDVNGKNLINKMGDLDSILVTYEDDSIVCFAELDLTQD